MSDIEWTVDPEMIEMDLADRERGNLVAHLILNDVIWVGWDREDAADEGLFVTCGDTFASACADCERLRYKDIHTLYKMWAKDPTWGTTAWCVMQRKERPIKPVETKLRDRGYDLDSWLLKENTTNAETQAAFAHAAWLSKQGKV